MRKGFGQLEAMVLETAAAVLEMIPSLRSRSPPSASLFLTTTYTKPTEALSREWQQLYTAKGRAEAVIVVSTTNGL